MCKITQIGMTPKIVEGYKVALKREGSYYSPSTLVKYEEGLAIPIVDLSRSNSEAFRGVPEYSFSTPYEDTKWFDTRHKGLTQIFKNFKDALKVKRICPSVPLVVLRVTGIMRGTSELDISFNYRNAQCYMVSSLQTIEEI